MIKNYKLFLESKFNEGDFDNFIETLRECQTELDNTTRGFMSYSYASQANKGDLDPEFDFKNIDNYMSKHGWDLNSVIKLSKDIPDFNSLVERKSPSESAAIDYYLYKITNKNFPLQGFEWEDHYMDDPDPEQNEYLIRFRYGWHKTRYGRLVILQNMGSLGPYFSKVREYIPSQIVSDLASYFKMNELNDIEKEDLALSVILEPVTDNKIEIYIDTQELQKGIIKLMNEVQREKLNNVTKGEQSNFDKFICHLLSKDGYDCRIITEGDIKATAS